MNRHATASGRAGEDDLASLGELLRATRLDIEAVCRMLRALSERVKLEAGAPQEGHPHVTVAESRSAAAPGAWAKHVATPRGRRDERAVMEAFDILALSSTVAISTHATGERTVFFVPVTEDHLAATRERFVRAFEFHPYYFLDRNGRLVLRGPAIRDDDGRIVSWSVTGAIRTFLENVVVDFHRERSRQPRTAGNAEDIPEDRDPRLRDLRDEFAAADDRLEAREIIERVLRDAEEQTPALRKGMVAMLWYDVFEPEMPRGAAATTPSGRRRQSAGKRARRDLAAGLALSDRSLGQYRKRAREALRRVERE